MKPFTSAQNHYLLQGKIQADMLEQHVIKAFGVDKTLLLAKRHSCIAGGPGIGKTYTVETLSKKYDVPLIKIQGVASMNALTIQLAVASYLTKESIQVWIDDCDSLFTDTDSLSVMKGILDEDRNILAWNKNMSAAIAVFEKSENANDQLKATALRSFQTTGGVGIEIPTDNMRFIITTNRYLTAPNPPPKTRRKMDEATIRDRVDYKEFNLEWSKNWGWMAHTALQADLFGINLEEKHLLLDWMFNNWQQLPSTSMRSIRELAADMVNYPDNYSDYWESRLMSKG
jgi:hypothetical protein